MTNCAHLLPTTEIGGTYQGQIVVAQSGLMYGYRFTRRFDFRYVMLIVDGYYVLRCLRASEGEGYWTEQFFESLSLLRACKVMEAAIALNRKAGSVAHFAPTSEQLRALR